MVTHSALNRKSRVRTPVEALISKIIFRAAEAAYHLLGGKQNRLSVYVLSHNNWPIALDQGETHWFIKDQDDNIIDPTAQQFYIPIEYHRARKTGFLTGEKPSLRTQIILKRIYAAKT